MDSAVVVALIGAAVGVSGYAATRIGQQAEARQQAIAARAADEHIRFGELESTISVLRVEADRARQREREAYSDLQLREDEMRRLRSDLAALAMVVRDEVMREAARTAHDIELKELPP
jgi:hypothetical protein